jgi:hypothetical protein
MFAGEGEKPGDIPAATEDTRAVSVEELGITARVAGGDDGKEALEYASYRTRHYYGNYYRGYCHKSKVWVPRYVWVERYVPGRRVYSERLGTFIFIKGHYATFRIEQGGRWEYGCTDRCRHGDRYFRSYNYRNYRY